MKHSVRANTNAILAHLGYDLRPNGAPRHPNFKYIPMKEKAYTSSFYSRTSWCSVQAQVLFSSELVDLFSNSSPLIKYISGEQKRGRSKVQLVS